MTIRSGLVVLIRCFMILLAFELVLRAIGGLSASTVRLAYVASLSMIIIPLLLVYWCAETIVDHMTPKSNEILADTPMRFGDLQAIVFSGVGAYVLVSAIRETIYFFDFLQRTPRGVVQLQVPAYIYLTPLASWVFGLYLLIGAPQLRRWLVSLRRANPSVE